MTDISGLIFLFLKRKRPTALSASLSYLPFWGPCIYLYMCEPIHVCYTCVCVYTYTYMDTCVYTHTHIIFSLYNETKRPLGLTLQHTATGSFCDFIYSIWRSIHVQYIYAYLRIHMHVWEHKYKHIYIYINTCAIRSVCG